MSVRRATVSVRPAPAKTAAPARAKNAAPVAASTPKTNATQTMLRDIQARSIVLTADIKDLLQRLA